ncbi:Flavinator of succinate dehydrogenase-domain-containing protein [Lineolata rhizophorae]|uniref:Succinate dehydrogenase assembly factor 2, mitochondrial n=1 Tax=Lineolata rhizophorae TaxID=578093 RepID=A0A6A6NZ59_9PEZI|nr:Flavinator of succinate dehydrogenase-domain-containing protein [Lineolata rhizophorae]
MSSVLRVWRSATVARAVRANCQRSLTSSTARFADLNDRTNDNSEAWRKAQKEKPLNPHMTNTNSTISNNMPKLGEDHAPPELLSSTDPNFKPSDTNPENTERMTGGTQKSGSEAAAGELDVGEMEGASFKVEPIRREGEDPNTMKARLLYQSRKRGTLESDLLLSTFADAHLGNMTHEQLRQYDLFLDENDWDIYYWATQEPPATSAETAEGGDSTMASSSVLGKGPTEEADWKRQPPSGEWAQTVGNFKPAYRPVPKRWKDSEVLRMLRKHVKESHSGGMAFMPGVRNFDN